MGKNLQNQDSGISLESTNPGCIKGLFHRFSNRRWNNVKRRLPYRRHSAGKLPAAVGDSGYDSNYIIDTCEEQGQHDAETANPTDNLLEPSSRHKGSMKSRIKALIVEELSKRRGRHRRSSSLPSPILEQNPSIRNLEASDQDPQFNVQLEGERLEYQDNANSSVSCLLDPLLPNISDESVTSGMTCNLCAATLTRYLRQSEAYEKHPVKDHILPEEKSIASLQDSKLSFDDVDLLDIKKELILKVFQDPNSLLCHHLHASKESTQKLGLRRFASFPICHSFNKGIPMLNSGENTMEVRTSTEGATTMKVGNGDRISDIFAYIDELNRHSAACHSDHDEGPNHMVAGSKLQDNLILDPQSFKNQQNNELSHKHFKRLRERVKHGIEERKKGRHRIIMDAILHKVPYGRRYWKNVKEDGGKMTEKGYSNGSGSRSYCQFGKSRVQSFNRTSSFNGPCERYNQLLDSHCNTEAKSCTPDTSRLRTSCPSPIPSRPKLLERLHSLPDLRSYSFSRIEGSPIDYSSMSPVRPVLASGPSIGCSRFCDAQASSFKNQIQSTNSSENGEVSDNFKDSSESDRGEGSHHHNRLVESPLDSACISTPESDTNAKWSSRSSTAKDPELIQQDLALHEREILSSLQLQLSIEFPKETNVISRAETPTHSNRMNFEGDNRNVAEFNYVKDMLERSGFSRNKPLGSWHSGEQPVNASVFAEVGTKHDEFPGNEESGICYKLVLFDLINQVLLEIYERSFSYWPVPITCRSRIHAMPIGHRVLEEVWGNIEGYLTPITVFDPSLDDAVTRDLDKDDGWMNIQFEAEGAGLELEAMIFHDLLRELLFP